MSTHVIRTSNKYSKSKNVKFSRKCDYCNKSYIGWGRNYCSYKCRHLGMPKPKFEKSPHWKGNNVTPETGRNRAYKMYEPIPCEICSKKRIDRCHLSGDTVDNSVKNVIFLCRKHHFAIDLPNHLRLYNRPRTSALQVLERKRLFSILKQNRREMGLPLGNLPPIVFPS